MGESHDPTVLMTKNKIAFIDGMAHHEVENKEGTILA